MDERARAEVALLLYCCMVYLVTVGSSPTAVCLLLLAMADRRKRTFRWDHRLQIIANTKTHEKNARKSARCTKVALLFTAVKGVRGCRWFTIHFFCNVGPLLCSAGSSVLLFVFLGFEAIAAFRSVALSLL